jgi:dihydrodipicolinate synthase/N-acetylneuraminate lyase
MIKTELLSRLSGITAVAVTPFRDGTGPIDAGLLATLTERMDAAGIHVITALGNTAEVFQLSDAERRQVLEGVAGARDQAALLAGITGSLDNLVSMAEFAAGLEYDAVMVHEPADPFSSSEGLEEFYERVADASPLPVVLYLRSGRLTTRGLLHVAAHANVVAVKYAQTNLTELANALAQPGADELLWICGLAESMVPSFAGLGIAGFTSGLANVRPDLALGLWTAVRDGDLEQMRQRLAAILPFEMLRVRHGGKHNISVIKVVAGWQGLDAGGVRPPSVDLDPVAERQLRGLVESWPELDGAAS